MRAGIGLIGLLVGVALMVYLFAFLEIPKIKVGKQVQKQATQLGGRGEDGVAASDSFAADGEFKGSTLKGLNVTSVTVGGAMDAYYGLRPGDAIVAIQGNKISDISVNDQDMAKALVAEAFSKKQVLSILRNGQPIELPLPAGSAIPPLKGPAAPAPQASAPPAEAPPNPVLAPSPSPRKPGGLERQLDAIQDAAGK